MTKVSFCGLKSLFLGFSCYRYFWLECLFSTKPSSVRPGQGAPVNTFQTTCPKP